MKALLLLSLIYGFGIHAMDTTVRLPDKEILKERIANCLFHCPDFNEATGLAHSLGGQSLSLAAVVAKVDSAMGNFMVLKRASSSGAVCFYAFRPALVRAILLEHPVTYEYFTSKHALPVLTDDEA